MSKVELSERIQLLMASIEILKLKADDYNWKVHTPEITRNRLDNEAFLIGVKHEKGEYLPATYLINRRDELKALTNVTEGDK